LIEWISIFVSTRIIAISGQEKTKEQAEDRSQEPEDRIKAFNVSGY
jgi:hypothetical protein